MMDYKIDVLGNKVTVGNLIVVFGESSDAAYGYAGKICRVERFTKAGGMRLTVFSYNIEKQKVEYSCKDKLCFVSKILLYNPEVSILHQIEGMKG